VTSLLAVLEAAIWVKSGIKFHLKDYLEIEFTAC